MGEDRRTSADDGAPDDLGQLGVPVEEVLAGLRVPELPDGTTPSGLVAFVQLREPDGSTGWSVRVTAGLHDEEVLGLLVGYVEHLTREAAEAWDKGDPTRATP